MKEKKIILTPEFLEKWSDKSNIPVCRMKQIFEDLKSTLKDCVNEQAEIKLCNFMTLTPTQPKSKEYYDFYNQKYSVKHYENTCLYKCKLSPFLKRPDEQ